MRLQVLWYSFVPFIGLHHVLIMIASISIILASLMLAGCTSESMSELHLLSLSYSPTVAASSAPQSLPVVNGNASALFADLASGAHLEVRVSYLGLCAKSPAIPGGWICSRSGASVATIITEARNARENSSSHGLADDPLNLIYMASKFRTDVVFVGLQFIAIVLSAVFILCMWTFPGWFEEASGESARVARVTPSMAKLALSAGLPASVLALASSFWQHLSSSATAAAYEAATYGVVRAQVGVGAAALAWTAALCQSVPLIGLIIAVVSM